MKSSTKQAAKIRTSKTRSSSKKSKTNHASKLNASGKIRLAVIGVLAAASVGFLSYTGLQNTTANAARSAARSTTRAAVTPPLPALGFTVHMTMPAQDVAPTFQKLAETGAKYVRIGVDWNNFVTTDAHFKAATAAGLKVLFTGVPNDYYSTGTINVNNYATGMAAAAKRYSHKGVGGASPTFEVWNEANPNVSAQLYTQLTCSTYKKIRAVDTSTKLIGASAQMYVQTPYWETWFGDAYAAGIGRCLDAISAHDYDYLTADSSSSLVKMRNIMSRYGDAKKPMWVTEMGATTCPCTGGWTEQTQSDKIIGDIKTLQASYPYTPVVMVYTDRDVPAKYGIDDWEARFGVFYADSSNRITTPKTAAIALKFLYTGK